MFIAVHEVGDVLSDNLLQLRLVVSSVAHAGFTTDFVGTGW